jgi:hypothetical protein
MTYVDDAKIPYRHMKMYHLVADSTEELLDMARKIGVKVMWIQHAGTYKEHFDVCSSKRTAAIKAGAVKITSMELGRMIAARKDSGNRSSLSGDRLHSGVCQGLFPEGT